MCGAEQLHKFTAEMRLHAGAPSIIVRPKIDSSHLAVPLAFLINLLVVSGNLDIAKKKKKTASNRAERSRFCFFNHRWMKWSH